MHYKLKIFASVLVAAALWFVLFSPFTAPYVPFWTGMVVADIVLITLTVLIDGSWTRRIVFSWKNLLLGVIIAAVLWGVFFVGDKLSQLMFSFARPQVDSIYGMKDESDLWRIGISLFLLIGPVEEIFWRGFVQKNLSDFYSDNVGFILTLLFYTAIHIPSGNFMLIMAAMVAGGFWGLIYRIWPQSFTALVVSHALWDTAAFVVFPI